jgi:hypothetical protein
LLLRIRILTQSVRTGPELLQLLLFSALDSSLKYFLIRRVWWMGDFYALFALKISVMAENTVCSPFCFSHLSKWGSEFLAAFTHFFS